MKRIRKGFTLIELLVVIAIIAILAAILFPVFAQAKVAAHRSAAISNVKQISLGATMYMDANDDRTMALYWLDMNPQASIKQQYPSSDGQMYWALALFPFVKNEEVFRSNTDRAEDAALMDSKGRGRFNKQNDYYYYIFGATPSFGYNYRYLSTRYEQSDPNTTNPLPFYYTGVSASEISAAASTVMFAEASMRDRSIPPSSGIRGGTVVNPVGYARIESPAAEPVTKKKAWSEFAVTDLGRQGQLYPRSTGNQVVVGWLDGHVNLKAVNALNPGGSTREEIDRFWNGLNK
jgi:prepilin-type N-terminal cleavage/methylation domain-containing protein